MEQFLAYEDYCRVVQKNLDTHLTTKITYANKLKAMPWTEMSEKQVQQLTDFRKAYSKAREDASLPTVASYVRRVSFFGRFLFSKGIRDYKRAKKAHVEDFLEWHTKNKKSHSTISWTKIGLKLFYRWLLCGTFDKGSEYPPIVSEIKIGVRKMGDVQKEDLPTPEEMKRLLDACPNPRDRALIHLMADAGLRLGEALNLKVDDLRSEKERDYVVIKKSKTDKIKGKRKVYLFDSIHDLRVWLDCHPCKNRPDFLDYPLFVSIFPNRAHVINREKPFMWAYASALKVIKTARTKAGIKKKLHPHLLRHLSASDARSRGLPDQLMCIKYGWSQSSSKMPSRYAHVDEDDVADFEMHARNRDGYKKVDEKAERSCPRCKESNAFTQEFCGKCGLRLSSDPNKTAEEEEKKTYELIARFMTSPEFEKVREQMKL